MGARGRVPKRIEDRLGKVSKATKEAVKRKAPPKSAASSPDLDLTVLHPVARGWFVGLRDGDPGKYMLAQDWYAAYAVAIMLGKCLNSQKPGANMFRVCWQAMGDFLTTEAARRRVRMELGGELSVHRNDEEEEEGLGGISWMAEHRNELHA